MSDTPPTPVVEVPRPGGPRRRISAVWLVPLIALIFSVAVAWRTYSERGPIIEIEFDNAAGIVAGQTAIRFRDVTIGQVESVDFTTDLQKVLVTARIASNMSDFIDSDARFWLVRPQVSAQGVTGIETVLSGVYIQAFFDSEPGAPAERFVAEPRAPLTPADQPGLRVRLRSPDGGSVSEGAPVLFKRVAVGKIEQVELTPEGDVILDVFIDAPHDRFVTTATRFWNASGFSIQIGASGASLNVESLISLLQGGIGFDTVTSGGLPVEDERIFALYPSESAARQSALDDDPENRVTLTTEFEGSVRGLQVGAPVELRGIRIGEVTDLQALVESDEFGTPVVTTRATLVVMPSRMGFSGEGLADRVLDFLELRVDQGLRAKLASANILTGALFVDLVDELEAPPAEFDRLAEPWPVLPGLPADPSSIAASAEGVLERVSNLPIEELLDGAVAFIASLNALVTDEAVRDAPQNLGLLLADIRDLVNQDGIQQAPAELAALLASVRGVVDDITERQVAQALTDALAQVDTVVATVNTAAERLPPLIDSLTALSDRATELPLDELLASATGLVDSLDGWLATDGMQDLPLALGQSLDELRLTLAELRAGGTVENVNATLASVDRATAAISDAAVELPSLLQRLNVIADEDLPPLVEELTTLSRRASELPLEDLVASSTGLVTSIDAFLATDGMQDLPASLAATLGELRQVLTDLREGGAVDSFNATMASTDQAAQAIAGAAADLPALIAQLSAVAARADAALATVSPGSEINRDTQLLLREVRDAARSVTSLATALERRPNSVLFGR
jgi:paraquat-inducible protein B